MMKLLISGTNSGLGQHFFKTFGGTAFHRNTPFDQYVEECQAKGPFDVILHCAFNSAHDISPKDIPAYLDSNAGLTQKLLSLPHKTFVFLSSAAVYPAATTTATGPFDEKTPLYADQALGIYPLSKMLAESYVQTASPDHIILRPTSLLGACSRMNTLMRIMTQKQTSVALSPDSIFNAIDHRDVSDFLAMALTKGWRGTFNLAASQNISLREAADLCGCQVTYGNIDFHTPVADAQKVRSIFPAFQKNSHDVLRHLQQHLQQL